MAEDNYISPFDQTEAVGTKPQEQTDSFISPFDAPGASVTRSATDTVNRKVFNPRGALDNSADPDKMALNVYNSIVLSKATSVSPDLALTHGDTLMKNAKADPRYNEKLKGAEDYTSLVAAMGASLDYGGGQGEVTINATPYDPAKHKTQVPVELAKVYAKHWRDIGQISEREYQKFLDDPQPIHSVDGVAEPVHFYDKDFAERAREAPQSFATGVNQTASSFFRGMQWISGEAGVNIGAKGIADWFAENAQIAGRGVRNDFFTDVYTGVGSMAMFAVPGGLAGMAARGAGAAAGAAGASAGLVESIAVSLEVGTMTVAEAISEAGGVFENVLKKTGSEQEANKAARATFVANIGLIYLTNRFGMFNGRTKALRGETAGFLETLGRGAAGEAVQEFGQGAIGDIASGEGVNFSKWLYEGLIGGIVGGGTSILLERASRKVDELPPLSEALQATYDSTVEQAQAEGATVQEAHRLATKEIAKTEEGQEYLNKVMDVQEAIWQAEASLGRTDLTEADVAPRTPQPARSNEDIFTEAMAELDTANMTDEEIETEILNRIEAEQAQGAEAVIQEAEAIAPETLVAEEAAPEAEKQQIEQTAETTYQQAATRGREAEDAFFDRRNEELRNKFVRNMTPEERAQALLTNELTHIPNRRAYAEDKTEFGGAMPVQVSMDLDSLKWVNDNLGHKAGDAYLSVVAKAIKQVGEAFGVKYYHFSGDEYGMQGTDQKAASDALFALREYMKGAIIELKQEDGTIVTIDGAGLSFGTDIEGSLENADQRLAAQKQQREKAGERAPRGEFPPNIRVTDSTGRNLNNKGARAYFNERAAGRTRQESAATGPGLDVIAEDVFARERELLRAIEGDPATGLDRIINVGRAVIREGINTIEQFTARMKEIMGDLYDKFKGVVRQAWDALKSERGSFSFADLTPTEIRQQIAQNQAKINDLTRQMQKDSTKAQELMPKLDQLEAAQQELEAALAEKEGTKGRVRRVTGQAKAAPMVREDVAFREGLRQAVRAAREAQREGRKLGTEETRQIFLDRIERARDKARQSAEVKKTQKRLKNLKKSKKQDISVDYQKKINEVLSTIDLKGRPTEKTLNNLISFKEWLDTHQDKMTVPPERLAQLDRLGKLALNEMSVEDVREIKQTIDTLVQLGKLKRRLQVKYNKERLAQVRGEFIATVNNIDGTFDPEEPTKFQNFTRGAKKAYMATLHTPRVADMMDGYQDYDGPHAKMIKTMVQRETNANLTTRALVTETMERIRDDAGMTELTKEQQVNIMIHIRLQEGAFEQVKTIMEKNGIAEVPELTEGEAKVIDILREATNRFTDQLAATVEEIDNQIFTRLDGYVLPLKYERGQSVRIEDKPLDAVIHTANRTSKTVQGFKKERVKGVKKTPRTDVLAIFEEAINEQQWYLNMQPVLEEARQIVWSEEYQEAAGDLNSIWWKDQIDTIARRGWSPGARSNEALRQARINLNQAVLGYKISSIVMQPFAIFDAMAASTAKWGPATTIELMSEFTKAWVIPGYAENIINESGALQLRQAGELAVEETLDAAKGKGFKNKFVRGGMELLQKADVRTAAGVRQGLLNILKKNGVENAEAEADFLMNMVSGSADVVMRPQVLSYGEGARLWFTFQSFFLNRWGIVAHDLVKTGLLKGDWKRKFTTLLGMAILMAGGMGEDEARKWMYEAVTGKNMKDKDILTQLLMFFPSTIPIIGPMIEAASRKGTSQPPIQRTVQNLVGGAFTAATASKPEARLKGALKATESAASLALGIPGTAQAFDLIERLLVPPKGKRARR